VWASRSFQSLGVAIATPLPQALGGVMDVGLGGVIFIWFCFLWPAVFVVICKRRARAKGTELNGFLALVISYAIYIGASYLPTIPLWVMGVDEFIESVGETFGQVLLITMFGIALLFATGLLIFIFRKMEKQIAT
jgi:hypothetical protein